MAQPQPEGKASVATGESATTSQQQQPSGPLAMATAAAVGITGNGNGNGGHEPDISSAAGGWMDGCPLFRVLSSLQCLLVRVVFGDKVSVLNANPLYVEAECVEGDRKGVTGRFMSKCVNSDNTFVGEIVMPSGGGDVSAAAAAGSFSMAYPGPSVSAYPAVQTALSHYGYYPTPYNGGEGPRVPGAGTMVQEVIVERPNGGVMQGFRPMVGDMPSYAAPFTSMPGYLAYLTDADEKAKVMSKLLSATAPADIRAAVQEYIQPILPVAWVSKVCANMVIEYCKAKLTSEVLVGLGSDPAPPAKAIALVQGLSAALPSLTETAPPPDSNTPLAILTTPAFHKAIADVDIDAIDENTYTKLRDLLMSDSELVNTSYVYLLALVWVAVMLLRKTKYTNIQLQQEDLELSTDGIVGVGLEACFAPLPVGSGTAGKDEKGGEGEGDK
ncbi:unnamed protein product [Vitrella brassicaformis CCMP3155]|uniref:Uncharacterized protein n=2 Tax=Vitrella brassicaformis TaxID=1169539 RepID=A0A0G4EEW0_VITBC|nr:unnamed protein product [Vitrella brassicaformis CCMP3155]|eukprot:CEL93945.1 unnamed protein product [Vitrella brassicaformis CCMP3155]